MKTYTSSNQSGITIFTCFARKQSFKAIYVCVPKKMHIFFVMYRNVQISCEPFFIVFSFAEICMIKFCDHMVKNEDIQIYIDFQILKYLYWL